MQNLFAFLVRRFLQLLKHRDTSLHMPLDFV
jgi:hypothetical protein